MHGPKCQTYFIFDAVIQLDSISAAAKGNYKYWIMKTNTFDSTLQVDALDCNTMGVSCSSSKRRQKTNKAGDGHNRIVYIF
jgi:hypothetical protein